MRIDQLAGVLALSLVAGCVGVDTAAPPTAPPAPSPSFVSIVGTPFLVAFKVPVCATSILLAGPLAAATALSMPGPDANLAEGDVRDDLDAGLNENCGPPYVVGP